MKEVIKLKENVYHDFGKRLKQLRKDNKVTQKQLASVVGITQSTVVAIEKGQRKVPLSLLEQLSDFFHISLNELIGVDYPNPNIIDNSINPNCVKVIQLLITEFPDTVFTDDELQEIVKFAKYIISKRV